MKDLERKYNKNNIHLSFILCDKHYPKYFAGTN